MEKEKKVKLKLYGPLKEKFGEELEITINPSSTASKLKEELANLLDLTEGQKNSIRVASDSGFLSEEEALGNRSVLHIIPPVGGG